MTTTRPRLRPLAGPLTGRTGLAWRAVAALGLLAAQLGVVADARGQSLTSVVAVRNPANSPDEFFLPPPFELYNVSFERESAATISSATATSIAARYTALVTADSGLIPNGPARLESLDSDWSLRFEVNAPPGLYGLLVETRRKGDLHLIEDNVFQGGHFADITAMVGTQSGGALLSGSLGLTDPGRVDDLPLVFDPITTPFDQTSTARIVGSSAGAAVAHELRFTWSQSAFSPAQGDEAAVRLGGTSDDGTETAGDYPGNPARVQGDDGHRVTVSLVLPCGDGVVDATWGEECDQGAANGGVSCCTRDCRIATGGTVCRAAAGICDAPETCSGAPGAVACPNDHRYGDSSIGGGFVCRPAAGTCDLPESCDGSGAGCPANTGLPDTDLDGVCDALDNCDTQANPGQSDLDGDLAGDACDACTNLSAAPTRPRLVLSRVKPPLGDDKLRLTGTLVVPSSPTLNPLANGMRLLLRNGPGASLFDATIPGGAYDRTSKAGWTTNPVATSFRYANRGASPVGGISAISLRSKPAGAGLVSIRVSVTGKKGAYPMTPGQTPARMTLVLDPPTAETGQCAETDFTTGECRFNASATTLTCKK